MPNAGDIRVKNGRVYVYTQPDAAKGPGTWRPSNPDEIAGGGGTVAIDTDRGLEYYDDKIAVHIGDGLSFAADGALQADVTGGIKGAVDLTSSVIPSGVSTGDVYLNTATGTFSATWAAVTDNADSSTTVAPNDSVVYDGSNWSFIADHSPGNATNLDVDSRTSTTLDVTSSTGDDATIPAATSTLAGLMTAIDKQAIDDIGDGTLTVKTEGGLTLGTFTANQSSGTEITIPASSAAAVNLDYVANGNNDGTVTNDAGTDATIPVATNSVAGLITGVEKQKLAGIESGAQVNPDLSTYLQSGDDVSELTNDAGYITSAEAPVQPGDVFSGDYNDLTNKPSIPANTSDLTNDSGFITSAEAPVQPDDLPTATSDLINDSGFITSGEAPVQPGDLFSGDYNDLTNKPSIPSDTNDLTNGAGFITAAEAPVQPDDLFSGSYNDLTDKPSIPSNTSDLTNDSGFITSADIPVTSVNTKTGEVVLTAADVNALPLSGDTMTGTIGTTERTITAGSFNLSTGNHWTCAAITVPAPTSAEQGTSGLIRITAGPVAWNTVFKFPGGVAPTISSYPSVIPFYVKDGSNILMGNPAQGIS